VQGVNDTRNIARQRGQAAVLLGWVADFADIGRAWQPVHDALDHRCLNDIEGLDNPTSERLAIWLWDRLKPTLPGLSQLKVMETHDAGCVYRGPA